MTAPHSRIHYWQSRLLPGVELSHSHHREFSYGRHVHLDYHIGLVQRGGQKFIHKGNSHNLVRGELSTVNPNKRTNYSIFKTRYSSFVLSRSHNHRWSSGQKSTWALIGCCD
jgi:hypothetical protein